jgi:predicted TIM-barrel fold metal-dependent hydrolase
VALPPRLANHELVAAAWEGLEPAQLWDTHVHLVGTGDAGSGIYINPQMESPLNPGMYARRLFFLNAGCVRDAPGSVDRSYVERMRNLVDGMRRGAKLLLLAFDRVHDLRGEADLERSMFYVPDAYARDTARAHPQYFEWAASIHPYRHDALEALARAKRDGARAVKWLPAAMGIDPGSPRCAPFYDALRTHQLPLITHAGAELAVIGHGRDDYGNPLRLRPALDAGVRVVIAHCASLGEDRDLDRGEHGSYVPSFALFERLMREPRYEKNLYGDISAMTQLNRTGPVLARVLQEERWQARLLNGSDYPLPGVMPIYSVDYLVSLNLVAAAAAPVLREIRLHNPLLFDFVLKRHLRSDGKRFAPRVFQTRSFFEPRV